MPTMISLVSHEYAGVQLSEGERFEAEDRDVSILCALGRASVLNGQNYSTRDMNADPVRMRGRRGAQRTS